ncbi:hypothetical protein LARI1_G006096 [Lachnellula arida]|uniref:Stress-associated endoplasmic reticulum protein n=1 Tax=Lachnellula arida TaxID=1316785 RepID=A0A8T9B780_9HELO|nr:hypothetical protein LARI1_G006096 [Lachnellula arida]
MAQTPEQRKRNAKFAKEQSAKRGKPASEIKKKQDFKSPISPVWLGEFVSSVTEDGYGWGGLLGTGRCMGSYMRIGANVFVIYSYPWICRLRRVDLRAIEQDLLSVKRHRGDGKFRGRYGGRGITLKDLRSGDRAKAESDISRLYRP